jgi:hypothetical protein
MTMTDDKNRIDLTYSREPGRPLVHLRGYHGDSGENEGVLAISHVLDASPHYPDSGRIIVGSPPASPLLEGYTPDLGGFTCGPDAAERLADELRAAAAAVRAAMAGGR